jgi:glycosyltransferase involved in cell wall biosynthesis
MDKVILCHKVDFPYVENYIVTFFDRTPIFIYENASVPFADDKYYLCVRRVPWELLPPGAKVGFVNTEPLVVPSKLEEYNKYAKAGVDVFDYSQHNITITGKGVHQPYVEQEKETLVLKKFLECRKEYDIAVEGTPSPRKTAIVEKLVADGFRVIVASGFGEIRDKKIAQASILLHLHYSDEYTMFDTLYCNRWRYAGMKIATEPCVNNTHSKIVTVNTETLSDDLRTLLGESKLPPLKIGLCMIVKNESHIIQEVMNATVDLIDTFVIVDTGSTDNTIECINKFYEVKGVPGKVFERPWKDFGTNRSEALALCDDYMDYIVMIDADDLMGFPANGKELLKTILSKTSPNMCNILIKRGTLEYNRMQIFKARDSWRYVGVLHEYPSNAKKGNVMVNLPREIFMVGRCLGGRSLMEGNKYKRDAEVLLKALETEPENERYMFYLAQSYRDAGMKDEAIEWYKKRIAAGKWIEEVYISALHISRMLNDKEWAWKAHEYNPKRVESLVSYMAYCRANAKWSRELLSMALYASTIPKPTDQQLFVETDCYDWRVWDELAIIAHYTGDKVIARHACEKLLSDNKMPPDQRERVMLNLKLSS